MTIRIENTGAGAYQVTVEGASTTVHSVTVTPEYLQKLTGGGASAEMLIEKSFGCGAYDIGQLDEWPMHLTLLRSILCRFHQGERVQRARRGFEPCLRQMQITAGGFQIRMAEQQLNGSQVRAGFKKVSREAVSEGMRVYTLPEPSAASRVLDCMEDTLGAHRHVGGMGTSSASKQVCFRLRIHPAPVFAKLFQQPGAKHDVAVLIALTLMNVKDHARAVYIADFQSHEFLAPHTGSVKRQQPDPMQPAIGGIDEPLHLFPAQDIR